MEKINDTEMKEDLKKFIEYIKPHLEIAFEGKRNGHNFNSYFPEELKKQIPIPFRDLVYCQLSMISKNYKNIAKRHFDFIDGDLKSSWNTSFDPTGTAAGLYFSLKAIESYLSK